MTCTPTGLIMHVLQAPQPVALFTLAKKTMATKRRITDALLHQDGAEGGTWLTGNEEQLERQPLKAGIVLDQLPGGQREVVTQRFLSSARRRPTAHPTPVAATNKSVGVARLPATVMPPRTWVRYGKRWKGLSLPVLTCVPQGRLGNVLGEYATMYAIKNFYKVSVVIHPKMRRIINQIFPNTSLPDLPGKFNSGEWKRVGQLGGLNNYATVELAAAGLLGPHLFIMEDYAFEIQMFNQFKDDLRKEFTLSSTHMAKVQSFLMNITHDRRTSGQPDPIFVGFHVRRTDYVHHAKNMFGASLPNEPYFERAIMHFRHKFPGQAVFIAASDDLRFIKSKLGKYEDVIFSPCTSALFDLAVLSSCNHSIITLGSYGFWSAFLTGGEVVYPDVYFRTEYRFSRAMYEMSGLKSFIPLPVN